MNMSPDIHVKALAKGQHILFQEEKMDRPEWGVVEKVDATYVDVMVGQFQRAVSVNAWIRIICASCKEIIEEPDSAVRECEMCMSPHLVKLSECAAALKINVNRVTRLIKEGVFKVVEVRGNSKMLNLAAAKKAFGEYEASQRAIPKKTVSQKPKKAAAKGVSLKECAELLGVQPWYLSPLVRKGRIEVVGMSGCSKLVDPEQARKAVEKHRRAQGKEEKEANSTPEVPGKAPVDQSSQADTPEVDRQGGTVRELLGLSKTASLCATCKRPEADCTNPKLRNVAHVSSCLGYRAHEIRPLEERVPDYSLKPGDIDPPELSDSSDDFCRQYLERYLPDLVLQIVKTRPELVMKFCCTKAFRETAVEFEEDLVSTDEQWWQLGVCLQFLKGVDE